MITSITIQDAATYKNCVQLTKLKKINFIYGSNGSGKTTISRVIDQSKGYKHCKLEWDGNIPLEAMVYNRDFIERNFNQGPIKGVFTLGNNQVEAERQIALLKPDIDSADFKIKSLNSQLNGDDGISGKNKELANLETFITDECWKQKQKHDDYFQDAFTGLRNSATKFKEYALSQHNSNTAKLLDLDILKKKASTIFGSAPLKIDPLSKLDAKNLISLESTLVMQRPIIGNQDVNIAVMINKLGNADWVKQGLVFHKEDPSKCPFCQQSTEEKFTKELNDFFSLSYATEIKEVETLKENYEKATQLLSTTIEKLQDYRSTTFKYEIFEAESKRLIDQLIKNKKIIENKLDEPSRKLALDSIEASVDKLNSLIDEENLGIDTHNSMVENIESEKNILTEQVWRFLLEELKKDIENYEASKTALEKTIEGLTKSLSAQNDIKSSLVGQVRELEKQSTSVLPTKDEINRLLETFGFSSFSIDIVDDHGHYRIKRENGEDASLSLSEGEKTFITFLYFYSLIKGAQRAEGTSTNRIVVFDDPISSLDSDILYIVSSLIKLIFNELTSESANIKQVFVLTHNVYFHKEITFINDKKLKDKKSFWIVKKLSSGSTVIPFSENPIKSAYELLWMEVKSENISSVTLQNTLRRIIETYFQMWGGKSKDDICNFFEGVDKSICQSLFFWANDGSHSVYDDLYINQGDQSNEVYLNIFRKIFENCEQITHYNMMMGID